MHSLEHTIELRFGCTDKRIVVEVRNNENYAAVSMLQHKCLIAAVKARDNNMATFNKARIERRLLGKQLFEQARNPGASGVNDCVGMKDLFDATRRLSQGNNPMPLTFFERNAFGIGTHISAMFSGLLRVEHNESRVVDLRVPIFESLRNASI